MNDSQDFRARKGVIDAALAPGIIAEPLASFIATEIDNEREVASAAVTAPSSAAISAPHRFHVIVELNTLFNGGVEQARQSVIMAIHDATNGGGKDELARNERGGPRSYVFAQLSAAEIQRLIEIDGRVAASIDEHRPLREEAKGTPHHELRAIFRIWESTAIGPLTTKSIRTIKADAAQTAYSASGANIVWAVMDSGIDKDHPHFKDNKNLSLPSPLAHKSFTGADPLSDSFGHGTHVAGIIAGKAADGTAPKVAEQSYDVSGLQQYHIRDVPGIRGMAPQCSLMSLQVLDLHGIGDATSLIQAIDFIQQLNDYGRTILVHGVNISVGYPFDAQWYACGQTPVCKEVNRLVQSGVVVVVAAGNTGHVSTEITTQGSVTGSFEAGQSMSINDPGNADLAITVGSTDREKPHLYGVSYYSSKGPTGDGRCKPDVVAPGEHIVSAAAGANASKVPATDIGAEHFDYVEDTGTSMAAPHVSGIVAGFLSIRQEFIGRTLDIRELVLRSAMDLKRDKNLQGAGLVDLMRLIQSV